MYIFLYARPTKYVRGYKGFVNLFTYFFACSFVCLFVHPLVNFTTKFCVKALVIAHISLSTYKVLFSSPVRSTDRAIVVIPASTFASGCLGLKFFKDPYLLNRVMDLLDTFTDYTLWSKVLHSTTHIPLGGPKVKVIDIENSC